MRGYPMERLPSTQHLTTRRFRRTPPPVPAIVAAARAEIVRLEAVLGAPDLVVEVLSPSTTGRDRREKMRLYERHGVGDYWIVDTQARRIERYEFGDRGLVLAREFSDGDTVESPAHSGFALTIAEAFRQ